MADDTLELIEPIFENNPLACPKNMLPYEQGVLLPQQQRQVNNMKVPTVREDQQYLAAHPEVNAIVSLLLRAVFSQRPKNIPEFMGNFMARQEVEEEIRNFLRMEMHTVVGRGTVDTLHNGSKHYHFIHDDEDRAQRFGKKTSEGDVEPEVPDFHKVAERGREGELLRTSISVNIRPTEEDERYRMSVISGHNISNPDVSTSVYGSGSALDQLGLRTLMAPRTDSLTHTDSVGTCSLLDEMDDGVARSISAGPMVEEVSNELPFTRDQTGADVGSAVGDLLNEEMIVLMVKKNLSGLSTISEQGVFMAVEVVEGATADGKREKKTTGDNRRSSLDSKNVGDANRSTIQEEDEPQAE